MGQKRGQEPFSCPPFPGRGKGVRSRFEETAPDPFYDHNHKNWGFADFRKLVLNAILWTAKVDVPADGVQVDVSAEELAKNLDQKPRTK
jgi:hypothetical protein